MITQQAPTTRFDKQGIYGQPFNRADPAVCTVLRSSRRGSQTVRSRVSNTITYHPSKQETMTEPSGTSSKKPTSGNVPAAAVSSEDLVPRVEGDAKPSEAVAGKAGPSEDLGAKAGVTKRSEEFVDGGAAPVAGARRSQEPSEGVSFPVVGPMPTKLPPAAVPGPSEELTPAAARKLTKALAGDGKQSKEAVADLKPTGEAVFEGGRKPVAVSIPELSVAGGGGLVDILIPKQFADAAAAPAPSKEPVNSVASSAAAPKATEELEEAATDLKPTKEAVLEGSEAPFAASMPKLSVARELPKQCAVEGDGAPVAASIPGPSAAQEGGVLVAVSISQPSPKQFAVQGDGAPVAASMPRPSAAREGGLLVAVSIPKPSAAGGDDTPVTDVKPSAEPVVEEGNTLDSGSNPEPLEDPVIEGGNTLEAVSKLKLSTVEEVRPAEGGDGTPTEFEESVTAASGAEDPSKAETAGSESLGATTTTGAIDGGELLAHVLEGEDHKSADGNQFPVVGDEVALEEIIANDDTLDQYKALIKDNLQGQFPNASTPGMEYFIEILTRQTTSIAPCVLESLEKAQEGDLVLEDADEFSLVSQLSGDDEEEDRSMSLGDEGTAARGSGAPSSNSECVRMPSSKPPGGKPGRASMPSKKPAGKVKALAAAAAASTGDDDDDDGASVATMGSGRYPKRRRGSSRPKDNNYGLSDFVDPTTMFSRKKTAKPATAKGKLTKSEDTKPAPKPRVSFDDNASAASMKTVGSNYKRQSRVDLNHAWATTETEQSSTIALKKLALAQEHTVRAITTCTMEKRDKDGQLVFDQDRPRLRQIHIAISDVQERSSSGSMKKSSIRRTKPLIMITTSCPDDARDMFQSLNDCAEHPEKYEKHTFYGAGAEALEAVNSFWGDRKRKRSKSSSD